MNCGFKIKDDIVYREEIFSVDDEAVSVKETPVMDKETFIKCFTLWVQDPVEEFYNKLP